MDPQEGDDGEVFLCDVHGAPIVPDVETCLNGLSDNIESTGDPLWYNRDTLVYALHLMIMLRSFETVLGRVGQAGGEMNDNAKKWLELFSRALERLGYGLDWNKEGSPKRPTTYMVLSIKGEMYALSHAPHSMFVTVKYREITEPHTPPPDPSVDSDSD